MCGAMAVADSAAKPLRRQQHLQHPAHKRVCAPMCDSFEVLDLQLQYIEQSLCF
jgi:hypothetical protein